MTTIEILTIVLLCVMIIWDVWAIALFVWVVWYIIKRSRGK